MRIFGALLALCSMRAVVDCTDSSPETSHTKLSFDDLPPALRLTFPPTPFKHLNFTGFSVFAPRSPFLQDWITSNDLNCAVSPPNALLGSRAYERGPGASFEIANANEMADEGLQPHFTLHSLQMKPMDAPDPGTRVWIKGYCSEESEPLEWDVLFPSGYHLPFRVDIEAYSGRKWEKLWKIEMGADFGYGNLDWEFCVDDIDVEFFEQTGLIADGGHDGQKVMAFD